jgi:PKD repeat protein
MFRSNLQPLDWVRAVYTVALWTVLFWVALGTAQAATITLAWNASTGATGYKVYQAETNETAVNLSTTHVTDASLVVANLTGTTTTPPPTTATVTVAEGKTYYFAVKAYNDSSTSGFSNEAGKTVPAATPAPVASFSATPLSGTAPLTVKFTDSSTNATAWSWNFGDTSTSISTSNPNTSTAQSPTHIYNSVGTYTVTLTATGSGGSNTTTKTGYITVTAPSTTAPVPSLTYTMNPSTGQVPVDVTFTGTWTGTATKWSFSGTSPFVGSSNNVTQTQTQSVTTTQRYSTPDVDYAVTFTVTGADGKNYSVTKTFKPTTVAPTANFTASATSGTAPLTVQFADTSTPTGAITGWSWNFGDASTSISTSNPNTSTAQNPTHTYNTPGTYTVRLDATNSKGTTSKTASITVSAASASTGGLVAAYNFEEASGATVVDASGQGNHGTISGATRTTGGKFGRALSFDGVDDWVTVNDSNSLDLTTGMTLEAWVYPTATMSGWRAVVLKEETGSGVYYLYANSDTNQPAGIVETSNNDELVASGKSQLPVNTWTHLAVTYNGQYQRLYVNGVEVAAQPQTGTMSISNGALRIGGTSIWSEFFKGRIDEIRIYNRALSATEIKTDMNTAVATSSPPQRLLGDQQTGTKTDTISKGTAKAFQKKADKTGRVTSLSVYVTSGSTALVAGLYANNNGRPGTLLAQGTLSAVKTGWNTVALPATAVTAGTTYWIAILSPGGDLQVSDRVGGGTQPSETSPATTGTKLPSTWWSNGTPSYDGPLSGYGAGY